MKMETQKLKHERRAFLSSALCALMLFFSVGGDAAWAQQPQQGGVDNAPKATQQAAPDKEKAREVAATVESLVTEFEVNGLKVLVKRRAGSLTVSAGLFLRGGARNITAENAGIESLMLDAMTEGSVGFPRETLRKELARMGTGISYGTNYDFSALTFGSTRANFDRSWDIFTDVALRPAFAPEDVKRAQNRHIISRRDDADTPDSFIQVLQSRVAYAGHPYMNDPDGTEQTLARLTVADLRRHHAQMMQTSRLLLVMVGDLDAAKLRERIAASFGKLPRGDYRPAPLPQLAFKTPTVDVTQRAIPTNYIQGVFAAPPISSEDYYAMRVASSLLNDRVLVEVRYKRNLSYAPEAFLQNQGANLGGISVSAVDANQAVSVMLSEISRLQHEAPPDSDIAKVISGYLTQHYVGQETNGAQAADLAMYELIGGGWRNSLTLLERLRAVTPKDVQRVAQKYMQNLRFVVLGDPTRIDEKVFTVQLGE
ncbi:MAG TPA: pitrilysin family protein [Pyrinomonadaceae bacterium]|nr:pitrilysin family protein [Pyrinomonadaceae bacterium]